MDEKRIEFPCTKKCLVYASCNRPCWDYKSYVEEAYRQDRYKCFKLVPEPPQQIKELSVFMNRVQNKEDYAFSYYPSSDLLIISNNEKDGIVPVAIINDVRKRDSIMEAKNFPQELKNGENKTTL